MSRSLKKLVDEHRFHVCMDAMSKEDCQHVCDEMGALLEAMEPVAHVGYTAQIGSDRESGNYIGTSHRRIYWFKKDDFAEIDLVFRQFAVAWMRTLPRHLQRWRYDSLKYCGIPLEEL